MSSDSGVSNAQQLIKVYNATMAKNRPPLLPDIFTALNTNNESFDKRIINLENIILHSKKQEQQQSQHTSDESGDEDDDKDNEEEAEIFVEHQDDGDYTLPGRVTTLETITEEIKCTIGQMMKQQQGQIVNNKSNEEHGNDEIVDNDDNSSPLHKKIAELETFRNEFMAIFNQMKQQQEEQIKYDTNNHDNNNEANEHANTGLLKDNNNNTAGKAQDMQQQMVSSFSNSAEYAGIIRRIDLLESNEQYQKLKDLYSTQQDQYNALQQQFTILTTASQLIPEVAHNNKRESEQQENNDSTITPINGGSHMVQPDLEQQQQIEQQEEHTDNNTNALALKWDEEECLIGYDTEKIQEGIKQAGNNCWLTACLNLLNMPEIVSEIKKDKEGEKSINKWRNL